MGKYSKTFTCKSIPENLMISQSYKKNSQNNFKSE